MKNLERKFVLTGLVFLLIGMGLGLKMSAAQDFTLAPLHAHLNLLGFVLMTLFGICYKVWPKMQEGILGTVHYVVHTVTVAIALSLLYFILKDGATYGPKFGMFLDMVLGLTWLGIALFAFLFLTRAKD